MSAPKTCITAPEPIEARVSGQECLVVAASNDGGELVFHVALGLRSECFGFDNPSPALLAFIARAERELLPPKLRGFGELTLEDLRVLVMLSDPARGLTVGDTLTEWASENNIDLPEAG